MSMTERQVTPKSSPELESRSIDARPATSSHSRPMSVWYLELDDEITDAVARLRAAKDDRVVFVVPPGSRIGTGRINLRLLAREAETRDVRIGEELRSDALRRRSR